MEKIITANRGDLKIIIRINTDPLNKFENLTQEKIFEMCGYIPDWCLGNLSRSLIETMESKYSCGLFEIKGGDLKSDGSYYYPGDPVFYPLLKIERNGDILFQYEYGIVSFINQDGSKYVTRMD